MQQLVGNWRQQVVDTAVEWLGYVPDPAIPDVDSAGFPVPNEEWLQQRQRRGASAAPIINLVQGEHRFWKFFWRFTDFHPVD